MKRIAEVTKLVCFAVLPGIFVGGLVWRVIFWLQMPVAYENWWIGSVLGLIVAVVACPLVHWLSKFTEKQDEEKPRKAPVLELLLAVVGAYGAALVPALQASHGTANTLILCLSLICLIGIAKLPYDEFFATRNEAKRARQQLDLTDELLLAYKLPLSSIKDKIELLIDPLAMDIRELCDGGGGVEKAKAVVASYLVLPEEAVEHLYKLGAVVQQNERIEQHKLRLAKALCHYCDRNGGLASAIASISTVYGLSATSVENLYKYAKAQ